MIKALLGVFWGSGGAAAPPEMYLLCFQNIFVENFNYQKQRRNGFQTLKFWCPFLNILWD